MLPLTEPRSWVMLHLEHFLQTHYSLDRKSSLEECIDDNDLILARGQTPGTHESRSSPLQLGRGEKI